MATEVKRIVMPSCICSLSGNPNNIANCLRVFSTFVWIIQHGTHVSVLTNNKFAYTIRMLNKTTYDCILLENVAFIDILIHIYMMHVFRINT